MKLRLFAVVAALASTFLAASMHAQKVYTTEDYRNAERWMGYNTQPLVTHTISGVEYLPDGRVFYRDPNGTATLYMIANPRDNKAAVAFDNEKLAVALRKATGRDFQANHLGVTSYSVEPEGFAIVAYETTYHCNATGTSCKAQAEPKAQQPEQQPSGQPPASGVSTTQGTGNAQMTVNPNDRTRSQAVATKPGVTRPARPAVGRSKAPFDVSPDKTMAAFIRDWNLWVRNEATGEERQLTTDGVKDFGYATDNAGWTHSDSPILVWSPDSKKIATFQQDQRKTGYMYLVPVTNRHPELEAWHYPLLGDKDVTMIQPVIIDVADAKITRLKMEPGAAPLYAVR